MYMYVAALAVVFTAPLVASKGEHPDCPLLQCFDDFKGNFIWENSFSSPYECVEKAEKIKPCVKRVWKEPNLCACSKAQFYKWPTHANIDKFKPQCDALHLKCAEQDYSCFGRVLQALTTGTWGDKDAVMQCFSNMNITELVCTVISLQNFKIKAPKHDELFNAVKYIVRGLADGCDPLEIVAKCKKHFDIFRHLYEQVVEGTQKQVGDLYDGDKCMKRETNANSNCRDVKMYIDTAYKILRELALEAYRASFNMEWAYEIKCEKDPRFEKGFYP